MMRVEVMMLWIVKGSAAYIESGHHLDLVQMQGISVQGCGGTIHLFPT